MCNVCNVYACVSLTSDKYFLDHFVRCVCGMYGSHRMRCCCDFMLKSFNSSLISYHNRKKDCQLRKRSNASYTPSSFQIQQDFMCTSQLPYKNRTSICIHKSCSSALQPNYFSLHTSLPHTSKPPPAATTTMAKSSPSNATKEEKKTKVMEKWGMIRNKQQSHL